MSADLNGAVLSAKESLDFLDYNVKNYSAEEYQAIRRGIESATTWVCYGSVLDECFGMGDAKDRLHAAPVKACGVPKVTFPTAR